jgi:preprotein translocase subunit SecG
LKTYFYIVQSIISISLIAIIQLQGKGSGGLGGIFGGSDGAVYKSRRGFEKTLYHATIGLAIVWLLVSLLSVTLSF